MKKLDCFQKLLEQIFYKYGKLVGRHPLLFIVGPLVITLFLSIGLLRIQRVDDAEELYTPTNGRAKEERRLIQNNFPENDSYTFIGTRRTILDGSLQVVITEKDTNNVFTEKGIDVALQVETLIGNVSVEDNGQLFYYTDICAAWKGKCVENAVLAILNMTSQNVQTTNITYPFHSDSGTTTFVGNLLGGVTLSAENVVDSAEALYLAYSVRYQSVNEQKVADAFLRSCVDELQMLNPENNIKVSFQSSLSLDDELISATDGITTLFSVTYFVLTFFASLSCNMLDPVRSKAWVATGGEIAAGLAILSSFGLLSAVGVPFASTVGSVPFLIMGIGIDDMFVIVSSWRHTSYTWSVEERMGKTLETAAISITVTSITDALAFGIGSITTFKAVTYFCAYAGAAVLFSYVYAITFCAACLSYSARIEHKNRHSAACCIQALPKSAAGYAAKSGCFKALCTGGDEVHLGGDFSEKQIEENMTQSIRQEKIQSGSRNIESNSENLKSTEEDAPNNTENISQENEQEESSKLRKDATENRFSIPLCTELIGTYIAPLILKGASKVIILILYILYLALSIWGCIRLQEGLHVRNLAPDGSYVIQFYDEYDKYFYSQYGPKVMVVFTDPLDYHLTSVQSDIQNQLQTFQNNEYFETENTLTESWLSAYLTYLNLTNQNPTDMASFINILTSQFLITPPYDIFAVDVNISLDSSSIVSSRFLIQGNGISSSLDERGLMVNARDIADQSPYSITVYAAGFIFYDQYVVIVANTLQNLGIAVVCMMFVSAILLPSLIGVIFVTLSVVSICIGVVGFMVFWDVNLDSISMINLIMCIGFSVDFSAHISYHFSVSPKTSGDEKASEALTYIGWPIIQGALSTILGVIVLAFSNTYIFRTFFKIMFLVMVFGFCHAFFILPVVLSLTQSITNRMSKNSVSSTAGSYTEQEIHKSEQTMQEP